MKFASRDGATARTLAVTAPGWRIGGTGGGFVSARPATPAGVASPNGSPRGADPADGPPATSKTTTALYKSGDEIFGPGLGIGLIYIVRTGCVRLYKSLPDGRTINVGILGPNTVFTQEVDPDCLSSGSAAEALVESTISIVAANDLADLISRTPELATALVHGMSRRLSEVQLLAEHVLSRDTSVRLATTLLALARELGRPTAGGMTAITLQVTHLMLASMVGSNRVTVTRKLLDFQELGAVKPLARNSLAVNPEKLIAYIQAGAVKEAERA